MQAFAKTLASIGTHVLLVYGGGSIHKSGLYDSVTAALRAEELLVFELGGILPNPDIEAVRAGIALCKQHQIDVVLAVGGGSVIDSAKVIAAGALTDDDPWQFFSAGAQIASALPVAVISTMSATGSDMDGAAVISNRASGDKLVVGSGKLVPKAALLDPELTFSVSAYQTACGAVDIMSHIMEVYFDTHADLQLLDGIMESMLKTVAQAGAAALQNPQDYAARANLMWAASWAINGFLNGARTQPWSCHPIEHALSAQCNVAHGHGLAIVFPRWLRYCLNEKTLSRYVSFGTGVFGIDAALDENEIAQMAISKLEVLFYDTFGLPRTLEDIGVTAEMLPVLAEKVCERGCIDGFVRLEKSDVQAILQMCLRTERIAT